MLSASERNRARVCRDVLGPQLRLNVPMTDQQGSSIPSSESGVAAGERQSDSSWEFSASSDPSWVGGEAPLQETGRTRREAQGGAPHGDSVEVRLAWLELPERLEQHRLPMPPATADFLQVAQLGNMITSLFWGNNDFYESPAEKLAGAQPRADLITRYVIALMQNADSSDFDADGRIIGYGVLRLPQDAGAVTAQAWVGVHPGFRRHGVGTALAAAVEKAAREAGRTVIQSWTDHQLLDPEAVGSRPVYVRGHEAQDEDSPAAAPMPQGGGPESVDTGAPALELDPTRADASFARACGFAAAQLELVSVLDLSTALGAAQQVAARPDPAGSTALDQYELIGWTGACPEEHAEAFAQLWGRMSQDAPSGELTVDPEQWDVDRLRRMEAAREAEGLVVITAAALHRPTGRIVGHSDIESYEYLPQAAFQANTLVHPDHRGHRLSLLLKARNIPQLLQIRPEAERLYTWNATENASILRANSRLGFVPAALMAAWEKSV